MAKKLNHWYLVTWIEMNGSSSWGDLPFTDKMDIDNMQKRNNSLISLVSNFLGRQIVGVTSFSYYGSEVVDE
jgi:hypothetical protein